MARIRSLHPGFWTDEAVLRLTVEDPLALLALIGLWGEADDHGLFEWKPYSLKVKVLPATNADLGAILTVLEDGHFIQKVTIEGRQYGAIRNFMVYQRPRRPSYKHPHNDAVLSYVGINGRPVPTDDGQEGDGEPSPAQTIPDAVRTSVGQGSADGVGEGEGIGDGKRGASLPCPPDDVSVALTMWNKAAERLHLPQALTKLSDVRRRKLVLRLAELDGLEGWALMLQKIEESPYLRGDNDKGWVVTLDFVLEPRKLTKLMEGNYAPRSRSGGKSGFAGATEDFVRGLSEHGQGDRTGGEG
jgi:hypothetical protein